MSSNDALFLAVAVRQNLLDPRAALELLAEHALSHHPWPIQALAVSRGLLTTAQCEDVQRTTDVQALTLDARTEQIPLPAELPTEDQLPRQVPGRYATQYERGREVELGRGAIGRVLAVRDEVVGREVALKQLRELPTVDAGAREARFLREARLTAQLDHPAVIPVFDVGRLTDGTLFYTMRRVRGRTLSEALGAARGLRERLALLPHLMTVAQALASAHDKHILHRDVKPQNVMLGAFGETYLLDWGLARKTGPLSTEDALLAPDITGASKGVIGTPAYMSPEQASGKADAIDERSDVWGVGAMLYEVLTGQAPFQGGSAIDVVHQVLSSRPKAVTSLEPGAPPELVTVCERALERDPAQRYQRAADLAADLEAFLQGRRVDSHDYSSAELAARFVRKNRGVVAVAAFASLALVVGSLFAVGRVRREQTELRHTTAVTLAGVMRVAAQLPGHAEQVDEVLGAALGFYERPDLRASLSDTDRALVAEGYLEQADIRRTHGHDAAAREAYERCQGLVPLEPLPTNGRLAARALLCRLGVGRLRRLAGDEAGARAVIEPLWKTFEGQAGRFSDELWPAALSTVGSEYLAASRTQLADAPDTWRALNRQVLALQREALRRHDDPLLRRALAVQLRDAALAVWDVDQPAEALGLGQEALEVARPLAKSSDVGMLVTLGSAARQQAMLLSWTDRAAEAPALFEEGEQTLRRTTELEPRNVEGLGELGDLLLERGRGAEAKGPLERAVALGAPTDYVDSLALALLLAGDFGRAVELSRAEGATFQRRWVGAVAAALAGDQATGAELARAAAATDDTSSAWPRGAVQALARRSDAAQAPAVLAFAEAFEAAFPGHGDTATRQALETFAEQLSPRADGGRAP